MSPSFTTSAWLHHARAIGAAACVSSLALSSVVSAQQSDVTPPGLEEVQVTERLEAQVPLDAAFRDHEGRRVTLGDFVNGDRPAILNLVYHSCPSFCSLVLDGVEAAVAQQGWTIGEDYDVITLSIDPRDTPEVAADERARVLHRYGRPSAEQGWHFLVPERTLTERENVGAFGSDPQVERVAQAVGFGFQWMPRQSQYAHPGVIMLLTPNGRVARYLHGLEYPSQDLRLGLLEASEGRSVTTSERVLLFCYAYDPDAQGYTLVAWRIMRVGGGLTAILVFGGLFLYWRREAKKTRRETRPTPDEAAPDGADRLPLRS